MGDKKEGDEVNGLNPGEGWNHVTDQGEIKDPKKLFNASLSNRRSIQKRWDYLRRNPEDEIEDKTH